MSTLLRIDSSPFGNEASFSRQLTGEFVQNWQGTQPGGIVIARDLAGAQLPQIGSEWVAAAHTPADSLTARQREVLALSDKLTAELHAADEYVIGVPMHNFSIPAALKLWIDQVVRAGKTFYANGAAAGLLQEKKATILIASGGVYEPGTPAGAMNFVEPYLRSIFAFMGVRDTRFITATGTARLRFGTDRQTIAQPALESIRAQFQTA